MSLEPSQMTKVGNDQGLTRQQKSCLCAKL